MFIHNLFVTDLHPDFEPRAPVRQHLPEVPFEAVVRTSLYGDPDALGSTFFGISGNMHNMSTTDDVHGDHGGQRQYFVDLASVVPLSAQFCLGSSKLCRNGRGDGQD